MATERLITPTATRIDEEPAALSLRPGRLGEYIGQGEVVERLRIALEAALKRNEPMDHVLLHGPPGLGKTTLAYVVAREMGGTLHTTSGPALTRGTDLVSVLTRLQPKDVLFIDEIHRMPIAVEEFIYPAMEDFRIDVRIDSGAHARTVQIACQPFTLIGATTRTGLISSPLRSRFGATHHLRFYGEGELLSILQRSSVILGISGDDESLASIARRSRGTPRIANRLLRRVRDYAMVRAGGVITPAVVSDALTLEGVDELGLDQLDRDYLRTVAGVYECGPVGLEAVAATMSEDSGTLEDVVEPFLLQLGFVARTRRGRMLTRAGCEHVGATWREQESTDSALFE